MLVGLDQRPERLEVRQHALAGLVAVEPRVGAALGRDGRVGVHDVDLGAVVPLADVEVVGVVGRRHLHRAGAEGRIDEVVGDDRDLAPHERQHDGRAHERRVALVVRVHGHAGVAEHRLRTGGGNDHVVDAADRLLERVAQVPQVTVDVLVLDLDVGQRRRAARAPVDDALALVDQPGLEPVHEHLADGDLVLRVHGEALVVVVAAAAHRLELADDRPAVLAAPVPARLDERLAPHVVAREPSAASFCSTLFCVAMPAWSVPTTHTVGRPAMRERRTTTSWIVLLSAWPMWSEPVTLGGGMTTEYGSTPSTT